MIWTDTNVLTRPPFFKEHNIAYEKMYGKRYFALYPDAGTAKTYMLLREFLSMWQVGLIDGLMIIAPVNVHAQWVNEELPNTTAIKTYAAAWPDMPETRTTRMPRIWAIYPEAFRRKSSKRVYNICKAFLQSGRIGLLVDESQMIGRANSKQRKRINSLKQYATYRRIASGFPAPKGLIQYYPQYTFLSTEILGCTTKGQFENTYCEKGGFKGKQIVGYRNEEEFKRRVAPWTYTVDLEKCHPMPGVKWKGMPGRTWETIPVELTDEQKKLIEQVKKEFRAVIGKDTILMPMALQRLMRIQQITCGFLPKLNMKNEVIGIKLLKENRTLALANALDGIRGKVIIWCTFSYNIEKLFNYFMPNGLMYYGGISKAERAENKDRFIRDPKITRLFANAKVAGAGFNGLTVSRHSIYWNNDFNSQNRFQSERRTWRLGQSQACWYGDLIAPGTYDSTIRDVVMGNINVSKAILEDVSRWLEE